MLCRFLIGPVLRNINITKGANAAKNIIESNAAKLMAACEITIASPRIRVSET